MSIDVLKVKLESLKIALRIAGKKVNSIPGAEKPEKKRTEQEKEALAQPLKEFKSTEKAYEQAHKELWVEIEKQIAEKQTAPTYDPYGIAKGLKDEKEAKEQLKEWHEKLDNN